MAANRALIRALRDGLAAHADPDRAIGAQTYMKSAMPFRGVRMPEVRRLARAASAEHPLESFEAWRDTLRALWHEAPYREERYAAIALLHRRPYAAFRVQREALELYEDLIVTGAWWDTVDGIATGALGELLRAADCEWVADQMRAWARSDDTWKRRAAIICQLNLKEETDLALLYDCIEPNLDDRGFFIRKAIGWALRQYARTDPDEVVRYVRANAERLSPLSKREALKQVMRSGRIDAVP